MKKLALIFCLCGLMSIAAFAQSDSAKGDKILPAGFKSDGCSMFPDGACRDCCEAHDLKYFAGGSWRERWNADKKLFSCVAAKKGWHHKILAPVMWAGVRVGGVPFLPTSFRWGFGKKKLKNPPQKIQTKQRTTEK